MEAHLCNGVQWSAEAVEIRSQVNADYVPRNGTLLALQLRLARARLSFGVVVEPYLCQVGIWGDAVG